MTTTDSSWSIGTLVGIPLAALLVGALVIVGAIFSRWARNNRDDSDYPYAKWIGRGCYAVAAVVVIVAASAFYPWKAEYHQWRQQTGTVQQISSRLLGGKTITQRFVVTFTTGDKRSCDDTRCSLVKPGDTLTLTCKRKWQYVGTDGYDCNYVDAQRPT